MTSSPAPTSRTEEDLLGPIQVPSEALYGAHTERALQNFPLGMGMTMPTLIHAYGCVKRAAAETNRSLGAWQNDLAKAEAIESACKEMAAGLLDRHIVIDPLQGGAGTSMNMNVNEVLANRALQLCCEPMGRYGHISPLDDINLFQSTNDTYPTALKLATLREMETLEESLKALALAFRQKEKSFASVLKIGRTQLQDAVPLTLGREMGAYAAAFERDAKRLASNKENLLEVNLGGTAIGTGFAAPESYRARVVQTLAEITSYPFRRAKDGVENTQNADVFVEISGLAKACAANFLKIATDLRLLGSGPEAGLGELKLPARQAGSSIMPGKVNPVIPEAATQAAMRVIGYDAQITLAASYGNLELNPFEPLIADSLLHALRLLANAADMLREKCIEGLEANEETCKTHAFVTTALTTALLPKTGYEKACALAKKSREEKRPIRELAKEEGYDVEALLREATKT